MTGMDRRGLLAALLALAPAAARAEPTRTFTERGLAIRGYDPVAYFKDGRPVRGSTAFVHRWNGAAWHFTSAANRDAFAADPMRYAPAYGGFCAFAVSEGYTAPIDPQAWRIVDGRLFLNYDRAVQQRWEADMRTRIARGDANWPAVAAGGR